MSLFIFYNICWFLTWPPHQCSQTSRLAIPMDTAFPLTAAHASPCCPSVGHGAPFLCKPQRAECVQQHCCKANVVLGPKPEQLWGPSCSPHPEYLQPYQVTSFVLLSWKSWSWSCSIHTSQGRALGFGAAVTMFFGSLRKILQILRAGEDSATRNMLFVRNACVWEHDKTFCLSGKQKNWGSWESKIHILQGAPSAGADEMGFVAVD